jgi:lysozyme family protein
MQDSFEKAFALLMQFEGGYVKNPNDPGQATKFGISQKAYPDMDIEHLTIQQAKAIYLRDYWEPVGADGLPFPLDCVVFDTAVNCGLHTAQKFLNETQDWKDYLYKRLWYYTLLVKEKPALKEFLRGWLNRVLTLWAKFS